MGLDTQTELSREETDAFLGRHETGVLAMANDDDPYSIPTSYGYDAASQRLYLRLVSTQNSEKRRYLGSSPRARFVVYEDDDPTYRSVLVIGDLEEISPDELTVEEVEQYGDTRRPLFEIWTEPMPDLDVQLYRLEPNHMSGRRIEVDRRVNGSR